MDEARPVDLQEELRRSANALGVAMHALVKRLRSLYNGAGSGEEEVREVRSLLDRLRIMRG